MTFLAYLASAFVILSPLSVATQFAYADHAKYLRLATTVLMALWGVLVARGLRPGPAVGALLAYVFVFVFAGIWSDLPHWALFNKGMFAFTCLSGVVLGGCPRSGEELRRALRPIGRVSIVAALMVVLVYLRSPGSASNMQRLALLGINANMLGQTAAPMLILLFYTVMHDRSTFSRWGSIIGILGLAVVIVATGSRGSLAMAAIGCGLLLAPQLRRGKVILGVGVLAIAVTVVVLNLVETFAVERIIGAGDSESNRAGIWSFGVRKFQSSPVIGIGWLHWGTRWGSVQNMYLQTLVESGVIGGAVLVVYMVAFTNRWMSQRRRMPGRSDGGGVVWFGAGLVAACLFHGLVESSTIMGTTLNALFLGFGTAIVDRAHILTSDRARPSRTWRVVQVPRPATERSAVLVPAE